MRGDASTLLLQLQQGVGAAFLIGGSMDQTWLTGLSAVGSTATARRDRVMAQSIMAQTSHGCKGTPHGSNATWLKRGCHMGTPHGSNATGHMAYTHDMNQMHVHGLLGECGWWQP